MLNLDNQNLYFSYHYRRVHYAIFNQKYSINLLLSQCLRAAYIQPLRHNRQRATTSKANTKAKRRQNQQRKQLSSPTDGGLLSGQSIDQWLTICCHSSPALDTFSVFAINKCTMCSSDRMSPQVDCYYKTISW